MVAYEDRHGNECHKLRWIKPSANIYFHGLTMLKIVCLVSDEVQCLCLLKVWLPKFSHTICDFKMLTDTVGWRWW